MMSVFFIGFGLGLIVGVISMICWFACMVLSQIEMNQHIDSFGRSLR
jgi:flagellar biosynthesis protein FliR